MQRKVSRIDIIGQNGNDGLNYEIYCKDCSALLTEENWWPSWRRSNNQRCIPCGRLRHSLWDTTERSKSRSLKSKYGISLDEYNKLWEEQGGSCSICGVAEKPEGMSLGVDHCHSTGKIRGLLCSTCNSGLGGLRDSIHLLEKAIEYLIKHK